MRFWPSNGCRDPFTPGQSLMLAAALAGCGTQTSDVTHVDSSGPVCPECRPRAGGESSDREGELPQCSIFARQTFKTDEQALELGYDMTRVRSLVEVDFSAPLRWSRSEYLAGDPAVDVGETPQGFATETLVLGSVRAASELMITELDPTVCNGSGLCSPEGSREAYDCADYVSAIPSTLALTIELQTADGAIEASVFEGQTALTRGTRIDALWASARVDLARVQGTLRLEPSRPGPYTGEMTADLVLGPDTVRGALSPAVYPDEFRREPEDDTPDMPSWQYQPLVAEWPGDGCEPGELPIDMSTPQGIDALRRLAEEYPAARDDLNTQPPMRGGWQDVRVPGVSPRDDVDVSIAVLDAPRPLCVALDGTPSFETEVHVWTSDGQLDWSDSMRATLRADADGEKRFVLFESEYFAPDAPFWTSALHGVDLFGAPSANVQLSAGYALAGENGTSVGTFHVRAVPDCEQDFRCNSADVIPSETCFYCNTIVDVARLEWTIRK